MSKENTFFIGGGENESCTPAVTGSVGLVPLKTPLGSEGLAETMYDII